MERRLSAILAADVVGYSRLMGFDEAGTLVAVNRLREEIVGPAVTAHHGRIVKSMGDGLLIEFPSVVEAVHCALRIQKKLTEHNRDVDRNRRAELRIGINVGDVIVQADDIFGDGVNVAARVESLAPPGGICISRAARDQMHGKLDIGLQDMGEIAVKNINQPIHAFRVGDSSVPITGTVVQGKRFRVSLFFVALAAAAGLAAATLIWWQPWQPRNPSLRAFGDLPAIAVLPFDNLSGDPKQEYFADGITEDLITDLSQLSGLLVIARNSAFTYKNKAVKVTEVGKELGVQYVVEGSVRRSAGRVRVNVQLIDAQSDHHIWAERFDRELTDVFELQDQIVRKIIAALKVEVTQREREQLDRRAETTPEAYDTFLRGQQKFLQFSRPANIEARQYFERAMILDPGYARAYAAMAITHLFSVTVSWSDSPDDSIRIGKELALKGLELDPTVREVYFALGSAYLREKEFAKAIESTKKSVELDPNYADGLGQLAWILNYAGQPEGALPRIQEAMRLHPHYSYFYEAILGQSYFHLGRYEEATAILERAVGRNPEFIFARQYLAATYGQMGRIEDAEWEISEIKVMVPDYSLSRQRDHSFYKREADLALYLEGLKKGGLIE
jgi:adenylate cyclase